jgi:UDP-glucose 6-dehydrogenase
MKVGIVGGGTVGRATARAFLEHCEEVRVYDVLSQRRTHAIGTVLASDLIFLCLPEGEIDNYFGQWDHPNEWSGRHYVLKSTAPLGTTRRLSERYYLPNLCHNPEFLTARCSLADAQMPARHVVGVPCGPREWADHNHATAILERLYERRFPGVPIFLMRSDESELLKLADNAFGAVKVSFFNELCSLCETAGLDWHVVRNALLAGGRIAPSYTDVPGHDGLCGWGGHCWPKDAAEFVRTLETFGLPADVTAGAIRRNEWDRKRTP